jgi:hypothetical protein
MLLGAVVWENTDMEPLRIHKLPHHLYLCIRTKVNSFLQVLATLLQQMTEASIYSRKREAVISLLLAMS